MAQTLEHIELDDGQRLYPVVTTVLEGTRIVEYIDEGYQLYEEDGAFYALADDNVYSIEEEL